MIKYYTKLGSRHLNNEATELAKHLKPYLKGMHCKMCVDIPTTVNFVDDGYGHLKYEINSCCLTFERRIMEKLKFD